MNSKMLSHELRIPLTVILGMTELLEDGHLTNSQHEKVDAIQQAGYRLLKTINKILNVANDKNLNGSYINRDKSNMKDKPKALLVEDELIVQKVHHAFLKRVGFQVDVAETAEQALEKAKNKYAVILMDVGLPDKTGIEATREIRQQEINGQYTPIIVLTGYVQDEIKQSCLAAGADAVYTKPINLDELQRVLQGYLKNSNSNC